MSVWTLSCSTGQVIASSQKRSSHGHRKARDSLLIHRTSTEPAAEHRRRDPADADPGRAAPAAAPLAPAEPAAEVEREVGAPARPDPLRGIGAAHQNIKLKTPRYEEFYIT